MKTGILTFHLAHNYGAVLQCYALQEVLRGMGHDVWVINYQQPYILEQFKPKRLIGIRSLVKALFEERLKDYFYKGILPYVKKKNFDRFRHKFLKETCKCYGSFDIPEFDLYVIGSDQPWNPDLTGGADLIYWGQFHHPKKSRLATYGMSGAIFAIGKVGWENVTRYCETFDYISFREESLTCKFSKLIGKRCSTVLDPTLMADANLWSPIINTKWGERKYVLVYHVGAPEKVLKAMYEKAKLLATTNQLEIIDASRYLYTPSDFVSLIKFAQYVITASFHAMVFSVIFKKTFVVAKTGQASDVRFENLLGVLGIENCLQDMDCASELQIPDYQMVFKRLSVMREDSFNYLSTIAE